MKPILFFIIMMVVFSPGCGVFTPREITTEPAEKDSDDPFMLSALLEGTGETFSRHQWLNFFNNDCQYTNVSLTGTVYEREVLVNYLLQQHELFPDIFVTWTRTEEVIRDVDHILLSNVTYTITEPGSSDTALFSGTSDFTLVRDQASVWTIIHWRDYSVHAFFSPE